MDSAYSSTRLMPCPAKMVQLPRMLARLTHLAQRSSEIKAASRLVIPSDIAMRDRPSLDLGGFGYRLAQSGAGEAIGSFVCPDPYKVSIELHENILRRSSPPGFIFVDVAIARRHEPGYLFRRGWVGDVEDADGGVEPGNRHDRRIGCAGRE